MAIPKKCKECGYCVSDTSGGLHQCTNSDGDGMVIYPNETRADCPMLDDELDAIRKAVQYRGESLYVTVVLKDKKPYEVFAAFAIHGVPDLYYMMSSINATTRLASELMKKGHVSKVISHLKKSSIIKRDFPGILSTVLEEYNG